jgi:NADPH-dependent curcumin reductase CurA
MQTARTNHEIRLVSRPTGWPTLDNFALAETTIGEPGPGEALVRITHMSVDPYMRGRMSEARSYVPPYKLDEVMTGGAVGFVIESREPSLPAGTWVLSSELGWREYGIAPASKLQKISTEVAPPSAFLGILGMPGLTAWVGLFVIGQLKSGETIFISSAGGAVGSIAGQLAKNHGARVIGSVGSPEKARYIKEEFGYDEAFDYHGDSVKSLRDAAPDGIDVYFDNVGGEQLQAALGALKDFGRAVECGMIAQYNELVPGPVNLPNVVRKRLRMQGFIVSDHWDRAPAFVSETAKLLAEGKIKYHESYFDGLANAPHAFLELFGGHKTGKIIVRVAPEGTTPQTTP